MFKIVISSKINVDSIQSTQQNNARLIKVDRKQKYTHTISKNIYTLLSDNKMLPSLKERIESVYVCSRTKSDPR